MKLFVFCLFYYCARLSTTPDQVQLQKYAYEYIASGNMGVSFATTGTNGWMFCFAAKYVDSKLRAGNKVSKNLFLCCCCQ